MTETDNKKITTSTTELCHAAIFEKSLADVSADLVSNGSLELSIGDDQQISGAKQLLPVGLGVFVPSPPKESLASNLVHVRALHIAGFEPVPHIAARRITSRDELENFLEIAVGECGVHRVVLIGGDIDKPRGPYKNGAAVLRDGILSRHGISEVLLPGYPEGHTRLPQEKLLADQREKVEMATAQGLCVEIVTQFCFAPTRIIEYCAFLAQQFPDVPVYVGMAGPTSTARLLRYANYCGVSASLRALSSLGVKVINLLTHTDPSEQLEAIAHYCVTRRECNVIGIHVFSFGGFVPAAKWMREKCRKR